jgi:hypothetical protein
MYVRHQQGRLSELVSVIDRAVTENPGLPAFRPVLAAAHLEAGNDATAFDLLEAGASDGFASLPLDFIWMMGITSYALVAVELRATGPARKLYDLLAPYHTQIPFIGTLGFFPAALALGGLASVLGRHDVAEAHFNDAFELTTRGVMKFFATRTELDWGRMLAARGGPADLDRARSLLEHARDSAATRGYAGLERQAIAGLLNLA